MFTPATVELDRAGVEYSVHRYEHDPAAESFGLEAAQVLGLDPATVFKTLMASIPAGGPGGRHELIVAIVAVSDRLDLKALARVAGAKRAQMASPEDAQRVSGYVVGGISPFGQRSRLRVFIDETAEICDRVYVSGGQRGIDIGLTPHDLISHCGATVAPIAA